MKIVWPYLRPYRRQLIVGPFFKLLEAILELFIPTLMAYVIDRGIRGNDTDYVFRMGFLMLGVAVVGLLFAYICQYSASIASQGFGTRVRNALFRHIGKLSYAQTQRYGASALVTRITNDVNLMQQGVAMVIRLFIRAPFICIGSIIMSLFIDWQLALIFVVSLPVFVLVIYLLMRKTIPLYRLVQERTDRIATILRENLLGVRVIRSFAKKEKEQERFREANEDYQTAAIKVGRLSAIMNPATALIMNLVIAAILYFGAGRVDTGHLTQGQITALLSYAAYMTNALVVLASLIVLLTKSAASAQRVAALLGMEPEPTVHGTDKPNPDCEEIVRFDHVTFSYYREEEEPAVEDICFTVRRGEHIGIIGGTGAGKSTLIHLLTGLYPFKQGEICFCGTEIRTMSEEVLRTHIAVAAQKALLLSGTVADNVRQGNPDASDSDILEALEQAQASFVLEKDQGIYAYVVRGGANFSGGQKQRLSIARALARKPDLLILDDSTSALDYATDAALRRTLRSQKDAMTVITISQRVSSLMHCDKILVLEDGRQLGYDTHENLRRNVPAYARLCEMQLRAQEGGGVQ